MDTASPTGAEMASSDSVTRPVYDVIKGIYTNGETNAAESEQSWQGLQITYSMLRLKNDISTPLACTSLYGRQLKRWRREDASRINPYIGGGEMLSQSFHRGKAM